MARLVSGGRSGGVANRARIAPAPGTTLALPRTLGAGSTFALRPGSHANLVLSGGGIAIAAPLAAGESQVALVREAVGSGLSARAVEYALTLSGAVPGSGSASGPYLPAGPAFAGVYGLARLLAAYGGPALRVRRSADGAESDIGFSGQAIDLAAAAAFRGASVLTVTAVYDQTGGGRHLIQPLAAAQPVLWLGEGGPTITNYDTDAPLLIPPELAVERADCAVFMVARTPGQAATCGYWGFGAGTTDFGLTSPRTPGNLAMQPMVDGASVSATQTNARALGICNLAVLGLVSDPGGQVVHRDHETAHYPAAAPRTLAQGGEVGEAVEYGGRTDWRAFVVCSAAPSAAGTAAIKAVLRETFGTAAAPSLSFLAGGDSIVFGTGGANNRTITAAMHHRSDLGVLYRNVAIPGHRLDQHYNDFDTASPAFLTPGVPNVYVADYGHNDIKTRVTDAANGASTLTAMKAQARHMAASLRAYGFDIVIWQEALADIGFSPAQEEARLAWNAWLRSGPTGADGLACFDAIDAVASDPAFSLSDAETIAGRGMALPANSSDGIHPNEGQAGTRAEHLLATFAAIPFGLRYVAASGQQAQAYAGPVPRLVKGTAPFSFALAPGSSGLPAGLALDAATGVVAGTPAGAGVTAGLVLRATDASGAIADAAFSIDIAPAATIAVLGQVESFNSGDATSIAVALPAEVAAGDVLVAVMSVDGNVAAAWDDATAGGWTARAQYPANSNAHVLAIFTRTADGTEGGKVLNVGLSAAQQAVTRVLRVGGASGAVEVSGYARGSTAAAAAPAIAPSWPGAGLQIAALAVDGTASVSAGPAGHEGFAVRASSASGQSTNATAWRIGAAGTEPAGFTLSAAAQWVAATIAVQAA
ncbi:putative Ig domain-containing protein [Novosphingobium soli]|uniref:Ig domain-containing protein n=1 Tax=Novosphingobium soli TaxID=574956 RepID=A0ABV6CY06_9SPHN